ncbi:hypothetical protein HYY71_01950 [Candidatus Woesearchaeota archaeon]|nr:hypothetical protein [Candidatus Woesearchaeota archaeon]
MRIEELVAGIRPKLEELLAEAIPMMTSDGIWRKIGVEQAVRMTGDDELDNKISFAVELFYACSYMALRFTMDPKYGMADFQRVVRENISEGIDLFEKVRYAQIVGNADKIESCLSKRVTRVNKIQVAMLGMLYGGIKNICTKLVFLPTEHYITKEQPTLSTLSSLS